MDVTKSRQVETDETNEDGSKKKTWEDYTVRETVNSRIPIWQRVKSDVTDEEMHGILQGEVPRRMDDPVSR